MSLPDPAVPEVQFAPASGGRIAFQDFGHGGSVMVAMPPLAQNIEAAWEWPEVRHMLERFGSIARYIHFDKRGTGASDRSGRIDSIDERVDDLRCVMDAAGVDRAHLLGLSEGGPVAVLFAVTYPERVESLILAGTGSTIVPPETMQSEAARAATLERFDLISRLWGTAESPIADRFAPTLAANPAFREWHQRYERLSASRDSFREMLEASLDVDVRDVLGDVDVPTLVIHRTGDPAFTMDQVRSLVDGIRGARYVGVSGGDHYVYSGDLDTWMDHIEEWVNGHVAPRQVATPAATKPIITTLGRFSVEVDGEPVPTSAWGSRLARQLCKRLVVARGWPITRDQLIDMLWPEEDDIHALRARLSVQLSKLRRVLGGGVVADRQTVRLDLDEVDTDLERFYGATDDAAIVAAYAGPLLPGDIYEDWTTAPRDEARSRFVTAARTLATAALERRDHRVAATTARRLIEADEYDGDAHRLLVTTLLAAGETREAVRAHDVWRVHMNELGVTVPGIETLA